MKLEKWSWIAAIIAVPVAITIWLVDRNQFITFCKSVGKIIITPFASAFNWLTHPVTWPVWAWILIGLSGLVIAMLFIFVARLLQEKPQQPNPFDYRTDEIFGVQWRWDFIYGKLAADVSAFCPQQGCMCRLEQQLNNNLRYRNQLTDAFPISLFCPKCGFKKDFEWNWQHLSRNVLVEVERRINTGEFQQRLTQNKS